MTTPTLPNNSTDVERVMALADAYRVARDTRVPHVYDRRRALEAAICALVSAPPAQADPLQGGQANFLKDPLFLLKELHAMVKGECPSLLDGDSGGSDWLALAIEDALAAPSQAEPVDDLLRNGLRTTGLNVASANPPAGSEGEAG